MSGEAGAVLVESYESVTRGCRIYARRFVPAVAPSGTVVVVHGMVLAGRGTAPLARELASAGFLVHLPDLPGFGRSAKPDPALDVPALGGAVSGWIEDHVVGPVILLGNSFGTQVAASAAARSGIASALVLMAPTIDSRFRGGWGARLPAGRSGGPRRRAERWMRTDLADRVRRRLVDHLVPDEPEPSEHSLRRMVAAEYLAAGPARALSTYRHALRDDLVSTVRSVDAPVLVVRGGSDKLVSRAWAERVATAAPQGELVEIEGADHDGQFDTPGRLAGAVAAWLAAGPPA